MKVIVGLGNPGSQYMQTRHNLGYMFLDFFAEKNNFPDFKYESKFKAEISSGISLGEKIILLKPHTYMNLSGDSLICLKNFYKLSPEDFYIIYDDISMDFGKIRFRKTGSAGGHNGVKDIIRIFGVDFPRIKVGVGFDTRYAVSNWVLSPFQEEELIDLDNEVYKKIEETLEKNI